MNTYRPRLVHPAALSSTGRGLAALTERSVSPDRKVTHAIFWSRTLGCDNAAVPHSQQVGRLATVADFGTAWACAMLKDSMDGPFHCCITKVARVSNAHEADWGLPTMRVVERGQTRLAVLDLALAM